MVKIQLKLIVLSYLKTVKDALYFIKFLTKKVKIRPPLL